ncbi:helix-turn-helix domain-containing protein [Priestia filamentosa]
MIDDLLKEKSKTRYWLAKEIGMQYHNLCKLADNKTESIKFDLLHLICTALECTPNDIFDYK